MPTMSISEARKNLFGIVDEVADSHKGYYIVGRRNSAVIISAEDWNAIQETIYLNSVPGLADSIREGLSTQVEKCAEKLEW